MWAARPSALLLGSRSPEADRARRPAAFRCFSSNPALRAGRRCTRSCLGPAALRYKSRVRAEEREPWDQWWNGVGEHELQKTLARWGLSSEYVAPVIGALRS